MSDAVSASRLKTLLYVTGVDMKKYTFEIVVNEGNDEFWEGIADKSGCDEVRDLLVDALNNIGLFTDDNCELNLKKFTDDV